MGLLDYERRFSKLNMNAAGGEKSPHKVAMLLAVIDGIESGEITANRIYFSGSLRARFKTHLEQFAGDSDRNNPHLPFFHLRSEGFWHYEIKPSGRAEYASLSTASSGKYQPFLISENERAFSNEQSSSYRYTEALRALLPTAVHAAEQHLKELKSGFEAERRPILQDQHRRLEQLKAQHETQLQLELDRSERSEAGKARVRDERQAHINRVFQDHQDWLINTQTTEEDPYLLVAAVFTGQKARRGQE